MDPSHDEDYYDIVQLFPTGEGKFDLSKINYKSEHINYCNWTAPRKSTVDEVAYFSDCPKVAKYIQDIYTKCPIENEIHRCKYLNYSINNIVKNDGNHNYNEEKLMESYNSLANRLKKCENSIKYIENSVFKNIKELSNIYYKFNKYINAIKAKQTANCEDVYDSVKLYLSNENTCNGLTNKFCEAVHNFNNYYRTNISLVNCEKVEYKSKPLLTLDNTKNENFVEEAEPEEAAVEVDLRGQEMSTFRPNQEDPPEMGQSKSTITTASSIVLVLSSASFIFYKFTPLGTWLRPLVQRKNKKTISMYDEALRFNNNSSIQTKDSENTEFNLQYHSSSTS